MITPSKTTACLVLAVVLLAISNFRKEQKCMKCTNSKEANLSYSTRMRGRGSNQTAEASVVSHPVITPSPSPPSESPTMPTPPTFLPSVPIDINTDPIPHRLTFIFCEATPSAKLSPKIEQNVNHTIAKYREAWGDPAAPVSILNKAVCRDTIESVEPRLLQFFDNEEERGAHKSDMCRVSFLFLHGGFYFDNDIYVSEPFLPPAGSGVTFWTSLDTHYRFFAQGTLGATPGHPILQKALSVMVDYYEHTPETPRYHDPSLIGFNMGTHTLKYAFDTTIAAGLTMPHETWLLRELNLQDHPKLFTEVERNMDWKMNNFVMMDPRTSTLHFWSKGGNFL